MLGNANTISSGSATIRAALCDQLDENIDALSQILRGLKIQRNALYPVARLPRETLSWEECV